MLQKQNIDIPVNGDLNTKIDERLSSEAAYLKLENVRFRTTGALKKRNGYSLKKNISNTTDLVSDNNVLLAVKQANFDTYERYDSTNGNFKEVVDARSTQSIPIELAVEVSDTRSLVNQDFDYANGVFCVVAESDGTSTRSITWRFIDAVSGESLNINNNFFSGRNPKVKSFESGGESYFFVIYKTGTTQFTLRIFNNEGLQIADQVINPATGLVTNSTLHLTENLSGNGVAIWGISTGGDIVLIDVDLSDINIPVFSESLISPTTKVKTLTQFSVILFENAYAIAYVSAAGGTSHVTTFDGSSIVVDSNALASAGPDEFTRVLIAAEVGNIKAWSYRKETAPDVNTLTLTESTSISGTFTIIPLIGAKYPVSEPFVYNGRHTIPCVTNNGDFRTGFLLNDANSIIGMYFNNTSFQEDDNYPQKPRTVFIGENAYIILNKTTNLETSDGEILSRYGLVILKLKLNNTQKDFITTKIGNTIVRSGGFLGEYDGASFYDNGFIAPFVTNVSSVTSGGAITAGTYLYKVVFEFIDKNGAIHRSEESNQVSITTSGSNSLVSVTASVPPSNKKNRVFNAVLYRTVASGSVFYRVTSLRSAQNQLGDSVITVLTDGLADSSITSNEILYTTGGVLGNDPCPPCSYVVNHNNTLFVINSVERDQINYSKRISNETGVSFSDFFFFNVFSQQNNRNENLTALASLREKLIIFKDASIHYVSGSGANDAGVNSTLTEPEMIYFDVGCTEPKSVVSTPMGVFFKSSKGIYLLDAGLGLNYIGAAVEAFNNNEILSSEVNEALNLIIFQTATELLIYDYEQNKWSIDTIASDRLVIYQNKPVYLKTETIFFEDALYQDTTLLNAKVDIQMKMVTGWLKLGNLQGFARVFRCLVLGENKSTHTLKLRAYYDYDNGNFDEYTLTPLGGGSVYQFGVHLKRQKCQSIKIEIFDIGTGESVQLSGISFEVGLKSGTFKLPANKRF